METQWMVRFGSNNSVLLPRLRRETPNASEGWGNSRNVSTIRFDHKTCCLDTSIKSYEHTGAPLPSGRRIHRSEPCRRRSPHGGELEVPAHAVALRSVLLVQEVAEAPFSEVGDAPGASGGVDLGVRQVGQPLAVGRHHP